MRRKVEQVKIIIDGEEERPYVEQAILDEFQETEDELGFAPTLAYRHN